MRFIVEATESVGEIAVVSALGGATEMALLLHHPVSVLATTTGLFFGAGFLELAAEVRFAQDSPLEGEGFEPSVPLATVSLILSEEKGLQADPARAGTAA
jgi:hypothetical protein